MAYPNYMNNGYQPIYGAYYGQQGYYNQMQQPQVSYQQQPTQAQTNQASAIPLFLVDGYIGAKAYYMSPNSKVHLLDMNNNRFFVKTADMQGNLTLETYKLVKDNIDENGNSTNDNTNITSSSNYLTKEDLVEFASKSDFKALQDTLIESMNKLSLEIKNKPTMAFNRPNNHKGNK